MKNLDEFDRLYKLIRVAVTDLVKCERDPQYKIRMSQWHNGRLHGDGSVKCSVCLAGSVMAQTAEFPPDCYVSVYERGAIDELPGCEVSKGKESLDAVSREDAMKYLSLNNVRYGHLRDAVHDFYGMLDTEDPTNYTDEKLRAFNALDKVENRVTCAYSENASAFKKDMLYFADLLEAVDL